MNLVLVRRAVKALGALDSEEQATALAWHRDKVGPTKRRKRKAGAKRAAAPGRKASGNGRRKKSSGGAEDHEPAAPKGKDALLAEARKRKGRGAAGENSDVSDET